MLDLGNVLDRRSRRDLLRAEDYGRHEARRCAIGLRSRESPHWGDLPISAAPIYSARGEFWAAADAVALNGLDLCRGVVRRAHRSGHLRPPGMAGAARPEATTPGPATGERATRRGGDGLSELASFANPP